MSDPSRTTQTHDFAITDDSDHELDPETCKPVHRTKGRGSNYSKIANLQPDDDAGPASDRERRASFIEEDEDPLQIDIPVPVAKDQEKPVTWLSLPHKRQLAILTLSRISEPLVQTSLRSYLFYQLKSYDKSLPDSVIASQAGIMQGAFAAAQLCTAMLWGRFSDRNGRKTCLLIGLFGTTVSVVGFGFSTSFWQAMLFRMMGGALNGNVGVMRTMISEIVKEKKYQSRAFLLLPMCANAGIIIGPVLGGLLADPASSYPSLFGGIPWLLKFPYAPPNLLNAFFLGSAACAVFFGLEETHEVLGQHEDFGRSCGRKISSIFQRLLGRSRPSGYTSLDQDDLASLHRQDSIDVELSSPITPRHKKAAPRYKNKLPFHRIFTYNVVCTIITHGLLAFSMGTFNAIFFTFISTPVYDPANPLIPDYKPHLPFIFTGGLGLPPSQVGFAMAILGAIGITLQLFLYPIVNARLGTVRAWRIFLYFFPIVYLLAPFLALIPSTTAPPHSKTGPLVWVLLTGFLFIQVIARTFATPASAILINNCSPHPSVLGTIHGIGQSASSGARTIGPALGGWMYGVGLDKGVVGAVYWALAVMAMLTVLASNWVREGDGHEIWLEGDEEFGEGERAESRR